MFPIAETVSRILNNSNTFNNSKFIFVPVPSWLKWYSRPIFSVKACLRLRWVFSHARKNSHFLFKTPFNGIVPTGKSQDQKILLIIWSFFKSITVKFSQPTVCINMTRKPFCWMFRWLDKIYSTTCLGINMFNAVVYDWNLLNPPLCSTG